MIILRIIGWCILVLLSIGEIGIIVFQFTKECKENWEAGMATVFVGLLVLPLIIVLLGLLGICH